MRLPVKAAMLLALLLALPAACTAEKECVLVEGAQQAPVEVITLDAGAALVRAEMEKGLSKKDAVKLVAKQTGLPRNALSEAALQDTD